MVPFCPESRLSGVGETDFMEAVWYRRTVSVPHEWQGSRLLLHFQAVDHDATVWVNGVEVVRHRGGWTPFTAELAPAAREPVTIVVRARDPRLGAQARGKQSDRAKNYGCRYTRTTGIWQTVWLEPVPATYMLRPRITPFVSEGAFDVWIALRGRARAGLSVRASLSDDVGVVSSATSRADLDLVVHLRLEVPTARRRLWSPEDPFLYDLDLEVLGEEGTVIDAARSYAGLRSLRIEDKEILLNGSPVFQRLVLDQGYYPDGVMTATSDEALVRDIELAKAAGFNGARLHQKVFEERFLYHCDRLGYLVWGEFGDWGAGDEPTPSFITQWLEVLERDYSHPAIVGWCPLNETNRRRRDAVATLDDVTRGMFLAAKAFDQTRPVLDASGWTHRVPEADVYDTHNCTQNPDELAARVTDLVSGTADRGSIPYRGQPLFVSEFGGIWWNGDADPPRHSWGYGRRPRSTEEFYDRFERLVSVLLGNRDLFGYCYTQLTDVYQEQNGIYRFDRSAKFDIDRLRAVQESSGRGTG